MAYCILVHGCKNDTIISQWWQKWVMTLAIPNHSNEHNVTCVTLSILSRWAGKENREWGLSKQTDWWIVCVWALAHVIICVINAHTSTHAHKRAYNRKIPGPIKSYTAVIWLQFKPCLQSLCSISFFSTLFVFFLSCHSNALHVLLSISDMFII